jgi:transposase
MWAKCGFQPQVKSAPTQEKVAFSGFVNPMTGELIINECDKFNYKTIMESVEFFLKNIRKVKKKKVLIVLDNASWHKKAVRLIRDDSSFSDIEFLFLPPYSPELNPIERVWRITRRERTHNYFFEKIDVLRTTLTMYFKEFIKPNEKIKTLCS